MMDELISNKKLTIRNYQCLKFFKFSKFFKSSRLLKLLKYFLITASLPTYLLTLKYNFHFIITNDLVYLFRKINSFSTYFVYFLLILRISLCNFINCFVILLIPAILTAASFINLRFFKCLLRGNLLDEITHQFSPVIYPRSTEKVAKATLSSYVFYRICFCKTWSPNTHKIYLIQLTQLTNEESIYFLLEPKTLHRLIIIMLASFLVVLKLPTNPKESVIFIYQYTINLIGEYYFALRTTRYPAHYNSSQIYRYHICHLSIVFCSALLICRTRFYKINITYSINPKTHNEIALLALQYATLYYTDTVHLHTHTRYQTILISIFTYLTTK